MQVIILGPGDDGVLADVAAEVFDNAVHPALAAEFLRDPRHHLAVAIDKGSVVGFASAVHYVHPDKPPELWINEIEVAARLGAEVSVRGLLSLRRLRCLVPLAARAVGVSAEIALQHLALVGDVRHQPMAA